MTRRFNAAGGRRLFSSDLFCQEGVGVLAHVGETEHKQKRLRGVRNRRGAAAKAWIRIKHRHAGPVVSLLQPGCKQANSF